MTRLNKPVKRTCRANVPYGVNPQIVVTLYPEGSIGLRELRHKQEYTLGLGTLYVQAMMAETRRLRIEKKKKRKEAKTFYVRREAEKAEQD